MTDIVGAVLSSTCPAVEGATIADAFDNNINTAFKTDTRDGDVTIDALSSVVVTTLGLTAQVARNWADNPSHVTIYGSNTSTTTNLVQIVSDYLDTSNVNSSTVTDYPDFTFSNSTAYRYYKIVFDEKVGESSLEQNTNWTAVAEVRLYTAANEVILMNTENATVQSSELGTAYLVKSTLTQPTTAAELLTLETNNDTSVNHVTITAINTNTNLALTGLVDGSYNLYTVDTAGNLSLASSTAVTVDNIAPILGTKTVDSDTLTIETDSVLGGTPLSADFTVLVGDITLSSTDYTVSLNDKNIVITLNSAITRSDIVKVAYSGTSVTDVAGNTIATFTSDTVTNQTLSGIDSTITAVAFEEPNLSIVLTGTNFNKILDLGNGELYTTDVTTRLNWDNIDWYIDGTTPIYFSSTDITSVYVNNNTTITITMTQDKWDSIVSSYHVNLLGSDDTINITAGFLKDADGTAATTDTSVEVLTSSYDGVIPTTDVYSSSITLNGEGNLDASLIKNAEGTLINLNDSNGGTNEDIGISSIGSNIGVIQNSKDSGTVTITGWDSDAVIDGMTILNNSTSNLDVYIDNLAGGLSSGTQINDLGFMGDNINIFFDDASANISLFSGSTQTLQYLGDGTINGGLAITGFSSDEDIINLSFLASVLDSNHDNVLDSNIFESGNSSSFLNTTFLGYDTTSGELLYDADGFSNGDSAIVLLTLTDNAPVVEADIKVI